VKPVKTLLTLVSIASCIGAEFFPQSSAAQCSGILKSVSYNSVISGTGNDSHTIDIPQFDPSKGTLVAVKITSVVSLKYAFQLENNNASATSYSVQLGRNDFISSSALPSPVSNMNNIHQNYGPYALGASNGVSGSGPDYISVPQFTVLNNYLDINDSITTSVANFLGSGTVEFDYFTTTYYNITGNYAFANTAADNINFTVAYYYCNTEVLASDIISFIASEQNAQNVKLSWATQNDIQGRTYEVQESTDGINFADISAISSAPENNDAGNYLYYYHIAKTDKDKIYFRIKVIDPNADIKYSVIRSIDLNEASGISLYPNPSNSFINIVFNQPGKDWQLDIFSSDGALMQRNAFSNTNTAHIGFINRLAPGLYFIHAYEKLLQKSYVLSFSVQ
jgi:hypothetical protein